MKSTNWMAFFAAGALVLAASATAQVQRGGGRPGNSPPSSSGGSERSGPPPAKPRENPSNPPQSGSDRGAPKQSPPPQSGSDRNPPKSSPPPKPRENPSNPPSLGRNNPPTGNSGGSSGPPASSGSGRSSGNQTGAPNRGSSGPTGIKQSSDPLGRIPRNDRGNYGGSQNNFGSKGSKVGPQSIRGIPDSTSLANQVLREDNVRKRYNIYDNGYRYGYYHYDPYWQDDYFWCSNYVFNPFQYRCVVSPWYYYFSLPGYLNYSCARFVVIPAVAWHGSSYRYYRSDSWGYGDYYSRRSDLDYAIDDLARAFENQDRRALGRIVPRYGKVHIYSNSRYDYSMEADDFYDLMLDGIFNSETRRYVITDVETYRDEAEVTARHEYTDPWGRRATTYHWYRLEEQRGNYVITRFGTSDRDRW